MPQRIGLCLEHGGQFGVGMAKRVDRDARAQIEEPSAIRLDKPTAFAFDKGKGCAVVGRQNGRNHRLGPLEIRKPFERPTGQGCQRLRWVFNGFAPVWRGMCHAGHATARMNGRGSTG